MSTDKICIRAGHLLDPAQQLDQIGDLHIADGKIIAAGDNAREDFTADQTIDAEGLLVCPGVVDLSARLREPGLEHKATIASEMRAAALSGITTVCMPPDTDPVIDEPAVVELIQKRAQQASGAHVVTLGALTVGLGGTQLSELAALKAAGCVGVSNGMRAIDDLCVLRRAMQYAATHKLTVHITPLHKQLAQQGVAHEGAIATRLGLPGIPVSAETVAIAQYLALVEDTGVQLHFGRLSSAAAVTLLAEARQKGLPVTADVAIHHLYLSELDLINFNSSAHIIPPLRSDADRTALINAVADGTIQAICSDHQPHERDAKLKPFSATEAGSAGLDTLLPLTLQLCNENKISMATAIAALSNTPANILGLPTGSLQVGQTADVCIFDPKQEWQVQANSWYSAGLNSAFEGWPLQGKTVQTLIAGQTIR